MPNKILVLSGKLDIPSLIQPRIKGLPNVEILDISQGVSAAALKQLQEAQYLIGTHSSISIVTSQLGQENVPPFERFTTLEEMQTLVHQAFAFSSAPASSLATA